MLNRYYEHNSEMMIEPFKKGVIKPSVKDAETIVKNINNSIDKLGSYIGYIRAPVAVDNETGAILVPEHDNMRVPIWDIIGLLKSKGVPIKVDSENNIDYRDIDISELISDGPVKYTSTKDTDGTQSSDRFYKRARTLGDTRKTGPELGTENGHSKEGDTVKDWEDAEFNNEKILLYAISKAFITVKNSGNWEAPITIPLFNYTNNTKDINFIGSSVKAEELIYFFMGTINERINTAYHFAIKKADERSVNATIEIKEKLDNDLGISNPMEWFSTALQVLMYGPIASAGKDVIVNQSDYTEKDSQDMANANFFESKLIKDKLETKRSGFTFVDSKKGYNDVGLFGLFADSVYSFKNLSYLGKYLTLKFKSADKIINSIVRSGEDSAEEDSKLPIRDVVKKEADVYETNNNTSELDSKFIISIQDALLSKRDVLNNLIVDERVDEDFIKIFNSDIIFKKNTALLDFYLGYLVGNCNDKGAVLYSGIFKAPFMLESEGGLKEARKSKDNKGIPLYSFRLSGYFTRGLSTFDGTGGIQDFFSQPCFNETRPKFEKENGVSPKDISIGQFLEYIDDKGRNLFQYLGTFDKLKDYNKKYVEMLSGKRLTIKRIRDVEKKVICKVFGGAEGSNTHENSETCWCRSLGLIASKNQRNRMAQAFEYVFNAFNKAYEANKIGNTGVSSSLSVNDIYYYQNRYFKQNDRAENKKENLEKRIEKVRVLFNSLYGSLKKAYDAKKDGDTAKLRLGTLLERLENSSFFGNIKDFLFNESLYNKIFKKSLRESLFESVFDKSHRI